MSLNFDITATDRNFSSTWNQITAGVRDASRQIEAEGGNIDRVINRIKNGVATLGIATGISGIASQVSNVRGEFQKLEVAFETMLGNKEKSDALMAQMIHTAAITPFGVTEVTNGAKQLLAFDIAAEDVNDTLIRLGDIASGLSIPLGDLVYLYGTTMTQGRMFTQDLRQFQGRGIPIADELAKQFGVAKDKVGELVTAGKVGAKEFNAAILSMTSEGGKFSGLMEKQSKTISGQISNIEDAIEQMFNEIGKNSEGIINATLSATSAVVENWQTVVDILGAVAVAYGAQKAVLALDAGFTNVSLNKGYDVEIAQLQALLPVKKQSANADIEMAVASGNLTQAKGEQIIALREEANAILENLAKKEAAAKLEEESALARELAAKKNLDSIDKEIEATKEKFDLALMAMDADEAETLATALDTLETQRNEAANIALAASEEARTATTNAATAAEARETLATQINTAETSRNAASTSILSIAKEKLAGAIAKVNKVIAANKFAIVTGAAIALGYAVYKLFTEYTNYGESIKKVNNATKESITNANNEIKTLDELNAKLSVTTKGSNEWKAVKDAIVKQFGQYIPQLDEEITKVGSLSSAYYDLKKAIIEANAAKGLKNFIDANDKTGEITEKYQEGIENFKKSANLKDTTKAFLQDILQEYATVSTADKDIFSFIEESFKGKFGVDKGQKIYNGIELFLKKSNLKQINEAHNLNRQQEFEFQKFASNMGLDKDAYNEVRYGIKKPKVEEETKDRKYWEQQVKDRKEAYEAILKTDKEGSANAKKAYDEAVAELSKYNSIEKKTSGLTADQLASKEESAAGKLADILRKQAQEQLQIQQDYEYERWQTRIDLMEEGEAKVLAQMQLDQAKEKTALDRRKEQEIEEALQRQMAVFNAQEDIKASTNKKYAKKVFSDSDIDQSELDKITERYDQLYTDLAARQAKAEQDRLDAAKESMNTYLQEFGNYQQKRLAIQEEYEDKIAKAQNEGERMTLTAQRDKALSDLDYSEWVDTGAIALAFGDISKLSYSTIDELIADMERYRDKVIATFDPDKIREYEKALTGLRNAQSDNSFGIFSSVMPEYFKQRKSLAGQKDSAASNVTALEEQRVKILEKIQRLQDVINVTGVAGHDTSRLESQLRDANVELDNNENATKKAKNAFEQLQEQWDKMNSPEDKFYGICAAVGQAASMVGDLANQAAEMADAMGADGLGAALGTLGEAMGSVQNVASGFANGGLIGGIAAAAGEAMKWVGKIFAAGDNRKQKNIERLQEQIDTLQKSYEKLERSIDDAFSTDASELIDQQNTLLQQQKVLIKQQMAEEEAKKKTDDDKIKEYKERLEEIDETLADNKKKAKEAIIGEDIKSAISEFAGAYASAWENGTDAASKSMSAVKGIITSALNELLNKRIQPTVQNFYDTLAKAMEDGILSESELKALDTLKAQMDSIAAKEEEQYKMILDRYKDLDELKEELTDISFDSVRDNFKSQLLDMEADASDFIESFTEMLRNAWVNNLMDNKYDAMLKEWYDEFAEAMNDQTLTDEERDSLRQQYQAIIDEGIADRNAINEIVGGGAYTQEASTGGWESMGQDQADELNGRFTALTELQVINNDLQQTQNVLASQILATLQSMNAISGISNGSDPTLLAIKDMMFLSTGYLEDIAKYTKILNTVDERLATLNTTIERRL